MKISKANPQKSGKQPKVCHSLRSIYSRKTGSLVRTAGFDIAIYSPPLLSFVLAWDLATLQLRQWKLVTCSRLMGCCPKTHSQSNATLRSVLQLSEKLHLQGLSLFDSIQYSLYGKRSILKVCVENSQWNDLELLLTGSDTTLAQPKVWSKISNIWELRCAQGPWNSSAISLGIRKALYSYWPVCMPLLKSPKSFPSDLWTTLCQNVIKFKEKW